MDGFRWKIIHMFCLISCIVAVTINTLQPGNESVANNFTDYFNSSEWNITDSSINETFTNNITTNGSNSSFVMFVTTTETVGHFPHSENHSSIHPGINNSQTLYNVSNITNFTPVNVSGTRVINSNLSIYDKNVTNIKVNKLNHTMNSSAYYSGHHNHSNASYHLFNKTKIAYHGLKNKHPDSYHPITLNNKAPQKIRNLKKRDFTSSSEDNSEEADEDKCSPETVTENTDVDSI
ncbi:unnamed protein product [Trichobilharzia szidati]|nr:unnamed protein product [Trichobilharzia szidati]